MELVGKGLTAIVVMWVMTGLSFILVPLRLITRLYVVKAMGLDDHVFNLGWVFLLLYTVFVHISGYHGFGQPVTSLEIDEAAKAVYLEMVGQTFAVFGMAIAKLSLGIFLLRIVVKEWHRITIWIAMVSLSLVSTMTGILFWVQRLPSKSIMDPRIPGHTIVNITPFAVTLGSWCVLVDVWFATLPWIFIWKLNMKYKEKLTIAISLSLGFIAGICGIVRTIELGGLSSSNYTEDTVSLIIWSAVELALTLICVGIPTVRPLYRRIRHGANSHESEERYVKHPNSNEQPPRFRMKKFDKYRGKDDTDITTSTLTVTDGNFNVPHGVTDSYVSRDNRSDERILTSDSQGDNGINVREEVRVETV